MRKERIELQKTVKASTPEEFDRQCNEATKEHPGARREMYLDGCVTFVWEEEISVPESAADKFSLEGIHYYCKDCPHLQKGKNRRAKSHGCEYAEFGTVQDFTPACEFFYKQVLQGKIKPEVE